MSIELTPKEVELLYFFSEKSEEEIEEINDYTLGRLVEAAIKGFTVKLGLVVDKTSTIKRIANISSCEVLGV